MLGNDRKMFYSYDSGWEHTFFDERTGGFVVTELARKYKPMSRNESDIFLKEQRMAMKYASFGFQIEHLNECPGISSPDVNVIRCLNGMNKKGMTADFKQLSSANNIYQEGKDAMNKKRADLVMFEFTEHFNGLDRKLEKLVAKEIHGFYYYSNENSFYSF